MDSSSSGLHGFLWLAYKMPERNEKVCMLYLSSWTSIEECGPVLKQSVNCAVQFYFLKMFTVNIVKIMN